MTTLKQRKALWEPILGRNDDVTLFRGMLVVLPVDHFFRFVLIDRTGIPDDFDLYWVDLDIFTGCERLSIGPGEKLMRNAHLLPIHWTVPFDDPKRKATTWSWDDPAMEEDFAYSVEKIALPRLRAFRTFEDHLAFHVPEKERHEWWRAGTLGYYMIALGRLDEAAEAFVRHPKSCKVPEYLNSRFDGLGDRLLANGASISSEDRAALASVLHGLEAISVKNLKLEKIWRRTPFPLEQG